MIDYSSPRSAVIDELYTLGIEVKNNKDCRCPSPYHEDKNASASVIEDNGHCRVFCHVCKERWDLSDLQGRTKGKEPPTEPPKTKEEINEWLRTIGKSHQVFTYKNASGEPVLHECRFIPHTGKPKDYRPFYPVDRGYRIGKPFEPWILYNLPEVLKAPVVIVVEGPKSADAINAVGLCATTGPFGAGKATSTDFSPLKGKKVILWPDNDEPGLNHMKDVAIELNRLECSVATLDVSKMKHKGDAADIEADEIISMVDTAVFTSHTDEYMKHNQLIFEGKIKSCPVPEEWKCFSDIAQPFMPQTVTVMHGLEGGGKSFFMIQLVRSMIKAGVDPAYLALEMPRSTYIDRLLSQEFDMPQLTYLPYKADPKNRTFITETMDMNRAYINKHMGHIHTARKGLMTMDEVCSWAEARPETEKVIIIDPITKIKTGSQIWVDHQELIDRMWKLAEEKLIAVVLVNHTNDDGFMSGGKALKRSSDTVYRVAWMKEKESICYTPNKAYPNVIDSQKHKVDMKLTLDKGRYATKRGVSFGFEFTHSLEFVCHGIIIED